MSVVNLWSNLYKLLWYSFLEFSSSASSFSLWVSIFFCYKIGCTHQTILRKCKSTQVLSWSLRLKIQVVMSLTISNNSTINQVYCKYTSLMCDRMLILFSIIWSNLQYFNLIRMISEPLVSADGWVIEHTTIIAKLNSDRVASLFTQLEEH